MLTPRLNMHNTDMAFFSRSSATAPSFVADLGDLRGVDDDDLVLAVMTCRNGPPSCTTPHLPHSVADCQHARMSGSTTILNAYLTALADRDFGRARAVWSDRGVWHVAGSHHLAADYDPDAYMAMLDQWVSDYPEYTATDFDIRAYGEDVVVAHLVTTGGAAEGTASGLMIFRVEGDLIAEGWAIPTSRGGRWPF